MFKRSRAGRRVRPPPPHTEEVRVANEKLMNRARDELFSHINRCGVLQATAEDQKTWMEETIDYLAERYPDLADTDLDALHQVGMRFCQPAIPHGAENTAKDRNGANAA
jgi:hypothetical protein